MILNRSSIAGTLKKINMGTYRIFSIAITEPFFYNYSMIEKMKAFRIYEV